MTIPRRRQSLSPLQLAVRVDEAVRAADLAADLVAHIPAADPVEHDILISIAGQIRGAAWRLGHMRPTPAQKQRKPRARKRKARA